MAINLGFIIFWYDGHTAMPLWTKSFKKIFQHNSLNTNSQNVQQGLEEIWVISMVSLINLPLSNMCNSLQWEEIKHTLNVYYVIKANRVTSTDTAHLSFTMNLWGRLWLLHCNPFLQPDSYWAPTSPWTEDFEKRICTLKSLILYCVRNMDSDDIIR